MKILILFAYISIPSLAGLALIGLSTTGFAGSLSTEELIEITSKLSLRSPKLTFDLITSIYTSITDKSTHTDQELKNLVEAIALSPTGTDLLLVPATQCHPDLTFVHSPSRPPLSERPAAEKTVAGKIDPMESKLQIDRLSAVSIKGHPDLTQDLKNAHYLGEGEFGIVFGLGESHQVIKVQKNDSIWGELEYANCQSRHIDHIPESPVAAVPLRLAKLELQDGSKRQAILKPRVYGHTLDRVSSHPDFAKIKESVEKFIEGLITYSSERPPEFLLNDFKLSNLMWGHFAGETQDHLIMIDVNCFDSPSVLSAFMGEDREKIWTEQYLTSFMGYTSERNWDVVFGGFHFKNPRIQAEYEAHQAKRVEHFRQIRLDKEEYHGRETTLGVSGKKAVTERWKAWRERHPLDTPSPPP